jgi:methyl-accepting chemotaxis protein
MALLGGLGLLMGLGLAAWLTRDITGPIGQALQLARRVAGGDLGARRGAPATRPARCRARCAT